MDSLYYNSLNTNVLYGGIEETERGSKLIDSNPTRHTALVIWGRAVKGSKTVSLPYKTKHLNMKKISNSLKILQGTLQDSKVKNYEGESIPGSIFTLTKQEQSIYDKIRLHLESNSASAEIDCIYISVAAKIVGQFMSN